RRGTAGAGGAAAGAGIRMYNAASSLLVWASEKCQSLQTRDRRHGTGDTRPEIRDWRRYLLSLISCLASRVSYHMVFGHAMCVLRLDSRRESANRFRQEIGDTGQETRDRRYETGDGISCLSSLVSRLASRVSYRMVFGQAM